MWVTGPCSPPPVHLLLKLLLLLLPALHSSHRFAVFSFLFSSLFPRRDWKTALGNRPPLCPHVDTRSPRLLCYFLRTNLLRLLPLTLVRLLSSPFACPQFAIACVIREVAARRGRSKALCLRSCRWRGQGGHSLLRQVVLVLLACTAHGQTAEEQRAVLVEIYNSMGGDSWTRSDGWMEGTDYCGWYGVTCDDDGNVIRLQLYWNGLTGKEGPVS